MIHKQDFEQIIKLSKEKDPDIRIRVVKLLGNLKNNASKKLLLKLAIDRNAWVRIESYDELSMFALPEVEMFLKKAIIRDNNELATSYAIICWAEIVQKLHEDHAQDYLFIKKLKKKIKIRKSQQCLLECYHAQYIWGEEKTLINILKFFSSKDYHVRYAVLHILQEIVNEENRELIGEKLKQELIRENALGLRKDMLKFLEQIIKEQNK